MTWDGNLSWPCAGVMQAALALVVLPIAALAPPSHGRTLLIPLNGQAVSPAMLERLMLTPIREGPLPGSIVVDGAGSKLAEGLLQDLILMVAATTSMCADGEGAGDRHEL